MATEQKVKVSERALIQRINRKLAPDLEKLCTSRSAGMEQNCGRFYVIDQNKNAVISMHVDVAEYAKDLGVLKPWEEMEEAE